MTPLCFIVAFILCVIPETANYHPSPEHIGILAWMAILTVTSSICWDALFFSAIRNK